VRRNAAFIQDPISSEEEAAPSSLRTAIANTIAWSLSAPPKLRSVLPLSIEQRVAPAPMEVCAREHDIPSLPPPRVCPTDAELETTPAVVPLVKWEVPYDNSLTKIGVVVASEQNRLPGLPELMISMLHARLHEWTRSEKKSARLEASAAVAASMSPNWTEKPVMGGC